LELNDKAHRLAGRRREQQTPVFTERYTRRSGIESTNSGLKNRLGLKRLRVLSFGAGLLTPPFGLPFGAGLLTPPSGSPEVSR
jgi:hypothetical protein